MRTDSFTNMTKHTVAAAVLITMAGCASLSSDGGFSAVERTTKDKIGKDVVWSRTEGDQSAISKRVAELLTKPLSADDAVQIALLNNRGLQADFAELGIAEADMVSASRLPNPGFSFMRSRRGDEIEIERGLHFNFARLLALPLIAKMESQRFELAKGSAATAAIRLAGETRKAYFQALAAEETVRYMRKVRDVAESSAELARRMAAVGNWSRLQQAREQGFYADAALNVARAEQAGVRSREALTRLLGLWGAQSAYALPERLPDLPTLPGDQPDIEQRAMQTRLDVAGAKLGAAAVAANLGLSRTTRFINVLEIGAFRETSNEAPTRRGYEISLELPLFDWGTSRVAKAEVQYMQAVNRATETAVNARSEVRESYQNYRVTYDIAKHYRDEVVPIRKRIADENLLRYNGMLIGVFD
ncbi:MAG: TolC family protein, partial [Burkholderiales bacterium]|nr:TolC family protein [Burkholderiales bacterium]